MLFYLGIFIVGIMLVAGCTQPVVPETPPATTPPTPTVTLPPAEPQNIAEIAVGDGRFTTLVAAVQEAGIADTLSSPGPFTVFAPTDDAFAGLPAGSIDSLLDEPEGLLTQILLYHVVSGDYTVDDLVTMETVTTLQGGELNITSADGKVMVNDATILISDIEASNGMIQVIDSVLLPP